MAVEALRIAVSYVAERVQFGVPIGSFQAVQHRLADLATDVEGGVRLVDKAVAPPRRAPSALDELAAMAFAFMSSRAGMTAAALHFHGGYGYTLEYDIQLYFRRAKGWPLPWATPGQVYAELGARRLAALAPARPALGDGRRHLV